MIAEGDGFRSADAVDALEAIGAALCGRRVGDAFVPAAREGGAAARPEFSGSVADFAAECRRMENAYWASCLTQGLPSRNAHYLWGAFEATARAVAVAVAGANSGDPRRAPRVPLSLAEPAAGPGLPAGARFCLWVFAANAADAVGAPGWCADVLDAAARADPVRVCDLWATLGTVAEAPHLDRAMARRLAMATVAVMSLHRGRFARWPDSSPFDVEPRVLPRGV